MHRFDLDYLFFLTKNHIKIVSPSTSLSKKTDVAFGQNLKKSNDVTTKT